MKIKEGFMLKEVAGVWVVISIGEKVMEFMNVASLTETGALIWKLLEKGASKEQIIQEILSEYKVDEETARKDFDAFIAKAADKGFLDIS